MFFYLLAKAVKVVLYKYKKLNKNMGKIKFSFGLIIFLIIFFAVNYFMSLIMISAHQGYSLQIRCHDGYKEPGGFCSVQSNGPLEPSKSYEDTCLHNKAFCRGGDYDVISAEPWNIKTPMQRLLVSLIMPIIYTVILIVIILVVKIIRIKIKNRKK